MDAARRQPRLVPGGSSGGSAAAVAARLALGATAPTPAARSASRRRFTGIVGRQADLWPLLALGLRGVRLVARPGRAAARTVEDCGDPARLDGRARPEGLAPRADLPVPDFAAACARGVKGLRIGVPREYRVDGMPPEIEALWQQGLAWLRDAGRGDRRRLAAAHEIRAADLLHRGPRRSLVEPRPL